MSDKHPQSERPTGAGVEVNPHDCFTVTEYIPFPDDLITWCMCQEDRTGINDPRIREYVWNVLLPNVKAIPNFPMDLSEIRPCAYHVNLTTLAVTPHDHLPFVLTTVLYLTDSEGCLVVEPHSEKPYRVHPRAGRMVTIHGSTVHAVEHSTDNQLRVALVVSYEFPRP